MARASMSGEGIAVTREGAITALQFDRPERRNAITARMYELMAAEVAKAEADASVRVILFHGRPEVFTAGNDIEDFIRHPPVDGDPPVFRFLDVVSRAAKPLVAAVNGHAVGIGTTLLLHCDLVYAGEDARFQLPFASLGVVPEFASSYLLPLAAGYHRAAELLLLAEPFGAAVALEAGIVTRVVPAADVAATAWEAARKLAALPAQSVRLAKQLMKDPHREAVARALEAEGAHFRRMLGEPAAREALAAFMEKRKPDFANNNS